MAVEATSRELLAKSPRGTRQLSLWDHLVETERAGAALFRPGSRWAVAFLRFFGIPQTDAEQASFLRHLRVAGLFHDIGKANEDFQVAMRARGFVQQSLRHEHLSALVLCHPAIDGWLAHDTSLDRDAIVAAVLSHHLKASDRGDWQVLLPVANRPTLLCLRDHQVGDALARVAELAGLSRPPELPDAPYPNPAWQPAFAAISMRGRRFADDLRRSPNNLRRQRMLALKAGLIAADSVASGLWRNELAIEGWLDAVAHRGALEHDAIENDILEPRRRQLGEHVRWHDFQTRTADIGPRGLLLAACGAGKTIAAWLWAQAQSRANPIGRVIFLYPTRGTATEGFRDYVAHAPEGDATLVHGTADYELAGMIANPTDGLRGKQFVDETEARLFALGLWNKRYFAATVDQFLGFIEHGYKGLCLVPALADAAVIFDEVHSYDERMFNALMTFLEHFDVPALCMTATLPDARRRQLETRGRLTTYPSAAEAAAFRDLADKETCPRYRLEEVGGEADALAHAVSAYRTGMRVLWVVNTVKRCQEVARAVSAILGTEAGVLVYHSRFRLCDRQARHAETIAAFRAPTRGEPPPAIAITTQVCEMSLDLDADVLLTEHAPVTALVQRFGRANRHLRRRVSDPGFRARLVVYPPPSQLPYDARYFEAAARFVGELRDRDLSQRDLAEALLRHPTGERDAIGTTSFLSGGFYATPGALREEDDTGSQVVLDRDVEELRRCERRRSPFDGLILTVPKRFAREPEGAALPRYLRVAEGTRYSTWLGFDVGQEGSK